MRIDNISSIERSTNIKPTGPQNGEGSQDKIVTKSNGYLKETPKNFKTIDPKSQEDISIGELELIQAIERANETLRGTNTSFKFSIHEETKAIVVKIINSDTEEIIREIPPEKILDMVAKMWEMAGILVDRHI